MILDYCALCGDPCAFFRMGVGVWLCDYCSDCSTFQRFNAEVGSDAEQPPKPEG